MAVDRSANGSGRGLLGGGAGVAAAEEVDAVVFPVEGGALGDGGEGVVEEDLELVGEGHVEHDAAFGADQVMVMRARDGFGQLEPGMVGRRDDPVDDPRLFEHGEVPISRTLGQIRPCIEQFGDRERCVGLGERLDQATSIAGVALVDVAQSLQRDVVDLAEAGHDL